MRNKHIFYDLYARVGDPEEIRGYINTLLQDLDWKTSLNEMTEFEELKAEGIFKGGHQKPVKSIFKSYKSFKKGSKFPILWKFLFLLGTVFLGLFLYSSFYSPSWNSDLFMWLTPLVYVLAILVAMVKEKVRMATWVKVAGVYNIKDESADVRIIIAADCESKDKEAYDQLEEDINELYNELNRKYVESAEEGDEPRDRSELLESEEEKGEEPEVTLVKSLKDVNKQLSNLNEKFINEDMDEDTYKEVKSDLKEKKDRLETMLDLVSTN